MWQLLSQPYPCEEPARRLWAKAFWIGVFVGLFLLVFQPFGLSLWETPYKTAKILGFGLISFVITASLSLFFPLLFPKQFINNRWTVGREILWITVHVTLIAIANYYYYNGLIENPIKGIGLFGMVVVTFLIGIFPSAGTVVVNYIIKLRKYSQLAREIPIHEHPTNHNNEKPAHYQTLTLTAENERDSLTLFSKDLLYIESSDNYSTVVSLKNNQPVKSLLRSSLSRLESQIDSHRSAATTGQNPIFRNAIVRCHRSYIVNLEKVDKVTGNAQGYKLHLHDGGFQLPVARKYNDTLVAQLKAMV